MIHQLIIDNVEKIKSVIEAYGATAVHGFATSAVRKANGQEFMVEAAKDCLIYKLVHFER